jgi:uncharacterized FlgJ-related protein
MPEALGPNLSTKKNQKNKKKKERENSIKCKQSTLLEKAEPLPTSMFTSCSCSS